MRSYRQEAQESSQAGLGQHHSPRGLRDLELDAKVELIRSLVPLGLMHVQELLDQEVTALAGARYARKEESVEGRRHGSNPGTVGWRGNVCRFCAPHSRRGERDPVAVLRGDAWRSCRGRPAVEAGAVRDLLPQLRGRCRGGSRGDRALEFDGVPRLHPGQSADRHINGTYESTDLKNPERGSFCLKISNGAARYRGAGRARDAPSRAGRSERQPPR